MMLDEIIAMRIDQPNGGGSGAEGGDQTKTADKVVEVVKRLIEFNGLDQ